MQKKPKIFSIGGATFDIFIKAHDQSIVNIRTPESEQELLCFPYGGKVKIDEVHETFGGGATNTSVAFSRMGFDAYFVGMVGTEYGNRVLDNLKEEKVHAEFASRTNLDKTSFSTILNTFEGERTVLAYSGANQYFRSEHLPLNALATADWIFLNHLTDEDSKVPWELLKILEKHPRIKLAWNPGSEQCQRGIQKWKPLLDRTEILLLNKEEAACLANTPFKPAGIKHENPKFHCHVPNSHLPPYADDVGDIFDRFLKTGVKTVVVTDGKNGAQACDSKRAYFCPVVTHKIVDTLGAGDAFASGFTSAFVLGESLKDALRYGTLNANGVISYFGAQRGLLTRKGMEKEFGKCELEVTSAFLK
jgi:ribokinase